MCTTVIALLSYEDFVAEVTGTARVVRVQEYYRVRPSTEWPEWHDFFVELAACREYPPQEIYVCRFEVGGGLWCSSQRDSAAENARRAVEALKQDLERRGFGVRPGLFADIGEIPLASAPWHFEFDEDRQKSVLVPHLPLQAKVREWKQDGVEVRIRVGEDEFDEMDKSVDLAGCNVVLRIFLGEEDADPVLAGIGLYLLGKAGVTIDAE